MVSGLVHIVRNVVGVIGNIISLGLFLSPVPTFYQIWKKGSVEQYSAMPYLATLLNCMVWVVYGLPIVHPDSILVITINGTGTVIEFIYVIMFVIYAVDRKQRMKVLLVVLIELIFIAIVIALVLTLAHSTNRRSMIVGILCILFNIMMYASPLSVMKMVITTKSVEYMPFFLSFASFLNGVAWTIYGFMPFDLNICIPNGIGTMFGLAQLILYATYYKSSKRAKEGKSELSLSEVVVVGRDSKKLGTANQNGRVPEVHD